MNFGQNLYNWFLSNAQSLDPYVIMKRTKDAESLAIDILTFLTGISSRDGEKFPVLRRAIRSVTQSKKRGLLRVIDELRKDGSLVAENIADHIESMTDYDFAHLLFSDGDVEQSISLDRQLNIIQVADLVLPDKDTKFEEYTTMELLSVAMLIVISTFALDFIHSDRSIFKMVDLDEAWTFLQVAQGKALSNKLIRAGRSMNAAVYFVTQNSGDVDDEKMKNNIGLKFAFRSTDIKEIKNLKKLERIYAFCNKIKTLPNLKQFSKLKYVFCDFSDNLLSEKELAAKLPKRFLTGGKNKKAWLSDQKEFQKLKRTIKLVNPKKKNEISVKTKEISGYAFPEAYVELKNLKTGKTTKCVKADKNGYFKLKKLNLKKWGGAKVQVNLYKYSKEQKRNVQVVCNTVLKVKKK